ncbi:hypothetical protein DFP72DRAFT_1040218 [Ephemerocybe angulata]|uniref:Uncharacterized protein n=1 Tax=Ephemerocybe angulata TaxID=980116 RepID=A0A8H6MG95_9AGAR|nr:hypothetical protein DFP72DRAFT_1040218 [Tulosesus angulatus]
MCVGHVCWEEDGRPKTARRAFQDDEVGASTSWLRGVRRRLIRRRSDPKWEIGCPLPIDVEGVFSDLPQAHLGQKAAQLPCVPCAFGTVFDANGGQAREDERGGQGVDGLELVAGSGLYSLDREQSGFPSVRLPSSSLPDSSARVSLRPSSVSGQTSTADANSAVSSASQPPSLASASRCAFSPACCLAISSTGSPSPSTSPSSHATSPHPPPQVSPQPPLSTIMGCATLTNGLFATAAGVVSNQLVGVTGSFAAPFIARAGLLGLAWVVIRGTWTENWSSGGGQADTDLFHGAQVGPGLGYRQARPSPPRAQPHLTCAQGSMYLFVFLTGHPLCKKIARSPASLSARSSPPPDQHDARLARLNHPRSTLHTLSRIPGEQERRSNFRGGGSSLTPSRSLRTLNSDKKSRTNIELPKATRANIAPTPQLSSLLGIPLNIFVVATLMTGVSSARYAVLTFSSLMIYLVFVSRAETYAGHAQWTTASVQATSAFCRGTVDGKKHG